MPILRANMERTVPAWADLSDWGIARMPAGQAVALLPFDWLRRSAATTAEFRELAERAKKELGAVSLHVRVTGKITDAAARELATIGWRQ